MRRKRGSKPLGFWADLYTIFSAIEKLLVVVGVPIAAYWTYFIFSTNDSQKARLRYENDLAKAKAFGLQIDIAASSNKDKIDRYISGMVTIKNMGVQYVRIGAQESRNIGIGRLHSSANLTQIEKSSIQWRSGMDLRDGRIAYIAIAPQRIVYIPFQFKVPAPGYYFLQFNAPVQFADGKQYSKPLSWGAKTIVHVALVAER